MRLGNAIVCALIAMAFPAASLGQTVVPRPGSTERARIMDTIRPHAERVWGAPVIFIVKEIRVDPKHAFISVTPIRPGGRKIRMMLAGGVGEAYGEAVLTRRGSGWAVVRFVAGASDVWWCEFQGRVSPAVLGPNC